MKGKDVSTLDDLVSSIESAPINPAPKVKVLYHISDWKKFVENKLSKEKLSYHSGYHCFKFNEEDSQVCFRGIVLSTDDKWYPPKGIKLLDDEANLSDSIEAAEFRFDHKKMKNILDDIESRYLPTLDQEKRQEVHASWIALDQTFQQLEKKRKSLKTLSFSDLPKYVPPPAPNLSEPLVKDYENIPQLWGTFHADEVLDGNVETDAKIGLDVIVYTHSKVNRPWVGVIKSIDDKEKNYSVQWYKRAPGGGVRFKPDMKGETAYVSVVDSASIMLYSVADHLKNGDLDLSEWHTTIMETYAQHDECYD